MNKPTSKTPFAPGKEPPPAEARPTCPGCGGKLRPLVLGGWSEPRHWDGQYDSYGAFCRLTCAEGYANYMFERHGTMLVRVKADGGKT